MPEAEERPFRGKRKRIARPLASSPWARGLVAALGLSWLACAETPPDVVLLTLDTTRADHLGVYGYPWPVTPSLDAFAAEALVFDRAWTVAPWTLPSHASILTGKHPASHGAHRDVGGDAILGEVLPDAFAQQARVGRLGEEQVTVAELLRERGYATAAFAGGPWLSPVFGLLQGYETQDADVDTSGGRPASELTDRAIAWLEAIPSRRPVHLLVNYFDPHWPYAPPPRALERVREEAGTSAAEDARRSAVVHYDGEIRFMDEQIERLLAALKKLGRYDDALVVVVADHGELFGEHGLQQHPPVHYEPLLRVPLIARLPRGRLGGTRVIETFSVVDLLPLIADEVGLALPEGVEGVRLGERSRVLAQSFPNASAVAHWGDRFDRRLTTLVRWPWKLTVGSRGSRLLYRLDQDPHELRNVAGRPLEARLRLELAQTVEALSPPASSAPPDAVPPETAARLRELGYAD